MSPYSTSTGGAAFCREMLPPARGFWEQELGKLTRPNQKAWALANCPFHQSQSKRSFSVNVESGAFHCFGCDARGGDLIAFLRKREGYSFQRACEVLGCWRGEMSAIERRELNERRAKLRYERELAEQRKAEKHTHVLALRNEIHATFAIYRKVSCRLSELRRGATEICPDEQETCWAILPLALDDLRSSESVYSEACGLEDPYGQ
jgi:transcriptional regulator with XRE-family HTH domain